MLLLSGLKWFAWILPVTIGSWIHTWEARLALGLVCPSGMRLCVKEDIKTM